jgi:uncharacterized protein (DUF2336 family)
MSSGILRTRNSVIIQLARVNEGTSKAKREELAKVNGSLFIRRLSELHMTDFDFLHSMSFLVRL